MQSRSSRLSDVAGTASDVRAAVTPAEPEPVQIAAVRAHRHDPGRRDGAVPAEKLARPDARTFEWKLPMRYIAIRTAFPMVLAALKNGEIQPWTLAFRHRRQLVMHRDPAIRDAARALLESDQGERAKVIAQYQPALDKSADAARGKQVFESVCVEMSQVGTGSARRLDLISGPFGTNPNRYC